MKNEQTDYPFLKGEIARELDFYKVRETISLFAQSLEGKNKILSRESVFDKNQIELWKTLGKECSILLSKVQGEVLQSFLPISQSLEILKVTGAVLSQEQSFALGQFCLSFKKAVSLVKSVPEETPLPALKNLLLLKSESEIGIVEKEIFSILDSSGELKEIPRLRIIKNKIANLHKEIENTLHQYTASSLLSKSLQSTVPVLRGERELIALKAEHKNDINGIVHEVSASGSTVFIEPAEVVRANNNLMQAEAELVNETRKVFAELTEKISEYQNELSECAEAIFEFDAALSSAKWKNQIDGVFAETADINAEPLFISGARHPLLGKNAVPVDIHCLDKKRVLIITGPNTGGKTVTLKTIALFALLNQAGFPLPAKDGTRIPLFDSIFADIGDEQSIEESLSTFSSHMKKTALATKNATANSLVLLDELASGTDPQEGGAIAMAVLDNLIEKNAFVIVTTHHGILKNYGYTNAHCTNACMEFDSDSLAPTFRLLMGVPGESHALDIAQNSGLEKQIVQNARNYLVGEKADVSALIKGLSEKHLALDLTIQKEKEKEQKLFQKELKLKERELHCAEMELSLKQKNQNQDNEFLRATRRELENLVRTLREGEITREKTLSVKHFISELENKIENSEKEIEKSKEAIFEKQKELETQAEKIAENGMRISKSSAHKNSSGKKTKKKNSNTEALRFAKVQNFPQTQKSEVLPAKPVPLFAPGVEVFAGKEKRRGTLVSKEKNNLWTVQFASLKMKIPQTQLVPVFAPGEKIAPSSEIIIETSNGEISSSEAPKFELRLLGLREAEALKALERQLDLCLVHDFKKFSIIHGKGTGVLQQAVLNYLSHYPGVKDFKFAPPEEGGSGKTYVELF